MDTPLLCEDSDICAILKSNHSGYSSTWCVRWCTWSDFLSQVRFFVVQKHYKFDCGIAQPSPKVSVPCTLCEEYSVCTARATTTRPVRKLIYIIWGPFFSHLCAKTPRAVRGIRPRAWTGLLTVLAQRQKNASLTEDSSGGLKTDLSEGPRLERLVEKESFRPAFRSSGSMPT